MPSTPRRPFVWACVSLVSIGLLLSLGIADRYAQQQLLEERRDEARAQLQLYAQNIHILVERYRAVPALLALDSDIHEALRQPEDHARLHRLNLRLHTLNKTGGSAVLYLLDANGITRAASNWDEPSSFVGHDYNFRPYFQAARTHGSGRYFAVGVTTGVPGYFLSHVVKDEDGAILGVLVLKLELEELQREWLHQDGVLLVTDNHGIVILSNRPGWRFGYVGALSQADQQRIADARKYARETLKPLPNRVVRQLGDNATLSEVDASGGAAQYVWQRHRLPEEGWELHLLLEPRGANALRTTYRLATAAMWLTLAFLLLYLYQRRKNQRLQARNRAELEELVEARTAELRTAQEELVQAAKMAALGQMSAALAHEINQPLTAMHVQLGSLRLLLDGGRYEQARSSVQQIDGLLVRMSSLTTHLKTFARKSPGGLRERLTLNHVIDQALALLEPRIRRDEVEIVMGLEPSACVLGDSIRLEQVLLNLLHNALDAMRSVSPRRLQLRATQVDDFWQLQIEDSGPGIAPEHLPHVFDPFFTTKPVGEGLGLGLAVSYAIVREFGGALEAGNGVQGACFTLRLPACTYSPAGGLHEGELA
ncbi:ATP-binding protein [Pseudomonas matsuisoli]|uniref:C4-dicarboxylate transport sensor protein DctB n=1 Tax=Pseudomonas matsuisoli TaxID=1515666 RepID=A0A917PW32_9PSED|nr:ATP-binding protein [Pseudomonas matsuisoli]GGJ94620.1 two-component sensor histidine kinase [Pseudomonas matsuisoli]